MVRRTLLTAAVVLGLTTWIPAAPVAAAPGEPDHTSGRGGIVQTDLSSLDTALDVLVQGDGKAISIGSADGASILLRHLPDGRLDTSFGSGGIVRNAAAPAYLVAGALQADGKIVVVGSDATLSDIVVRRHLPTGALDASFGTGGSVQTDLGSADDGRGVAIQPDGRIVVVGRSGTSVAVLRYTAAGAPDATFGSGGRTVTAFGGAGAQAEAEAVALLSTGSVVVAGRVAPANGNVTMLLARYTSAGQLDPTYGAGGSVPAASSRLSSATSLVVQSGDRVVVGGNVIVGQGTAHAIARHLSEGGLDPSFGTGGVTQRTLGTFSGTQDLVLDGAGRIVAVGDATYAADQPAGFVFVAVIRLSSEGMPDAGFGCGGHVLVEPYAAGGGRAIGVGLDPNGVIVAAGVAFADPATDTGRPDMLLVRLLGGGGAATGYWIGRADGGVSAFGTASACGSLRGMRLNRPVVGLAGRPSLDGYWLVATDGGIFSFGDAPFFGSAGAIPLNRPIVGMAATPSGNGYWLVASDGGIFAYGDASFHGSTGAMVLNKPVVGMAATPSGKGYWLVASDGGIFAFGDAGFHGSTGAMVLNKPVVGMASTPSGTGYWLVASDGGIFAFDAPFQGSTGAMVLNKPVVGMTRTPAGDGYWLAASDGGVFAFNAPFTGSTGNQPFASPAVAIT